MTRSLVVATQNDGKVREFARLFIPFGWRVERLPMDAPKVIEDGDSFAANAIKKAEAAALYTGKAALADDSGLVVDALEGRPGIYSARYAGPEATDERNNQMLLEEMQPIPTAERRARYVAVLALAIPGEDTVVTTGTCEGSIIHHPRGTNGFGYDPLFMPCGSNRTMAEISAEEKDAISHRAKAMAAMSTYLQSRWQSS